MLQLSKILSRQPDLAYVWIVPMRSVLSAIRIGLAHAEVARCLTLLMTNRYAYAASLRRIEDVSDEIPGL